MFSIRAIFAVGLSLLCTLPAWADDATIPPIPDSVRQSAALDRDQIQTIDDCLTQVVKSLADGSNPTAQSLDRQWLMDSVAGSDDYQQHYAQRLAAYLLPMVSAPDANFRARIEAGLACQKVAEDTHSTALTPVAIVLLKDRSPAVAWAGMKTARALLRTVFAQTRLSAADKQLVDEVVAAVGRQPDPPMAGIIAEEAYHAFLDPVLNAQANLPPEIQTTLVTAVMKLWQERIALYQNSPPDNPGADTTGMITLLSRGIWPNLAVAQQRDVIKATGDLIGQTAKWAIAAKSGSESGIDSAPLVDALQRDGRELHEDFSDPGRGTAPNQALYNATAHLQSIGSGVGVGAIKADADAAVQALNDFAGQL
jgi:hypothetical protein